MLGSAALRSLETLNRAANRKTTDTAPRHPDAIQRERCGEGAQPTARLLLHMSIRAASNANDGRSSAARTHGGLAISRKGSTQAPDFRLATRDRDPGLAADPPVAGPGAVDTVADLRLRRPCPDVGKWGGSGAATTVAAMERLRRGKRTSRRGSRIVATVLEYAVGAEVTW